MAAGASPDPLSHFLSSRVQVWPGSVFFPSYLLPKTTDWLKRQMQAMYDQVPFGECAASVAARLWQHHVGSE